MRVRTLVWPGLALLLSTGVATASPLFSLDGTLQSEHPLVVSGAVVAEPDLAGSYAYLHAVPETKVGNPRLVDADKLTATLHEWNTLEGEVAVRNPLSTRVHTHARLDLLEIDPGTGQFAVYDRWTGSPAGRLSTGAARCDVQDAPEAQVLEYPQDSEKAPQAAHTYAPTATQLVAQCRTNLLAGEGAGRLLFYGMKVRLSSDQDKNGQVYETGSRKVSVDAGPSEGIVQQTITTVLEVVWTGTPIRSSFDLDVTARMYSHGFLAAGELAGPTATGRLAWGDWVQDGTVEPFEATGEFQLAWAPGPGIGVQGTTITEPLVPSAQGAGFAPSDVPWVPLAAAAAGLGFLAILARLLWPLFSKLAPDQVLEHPRRQRIYEFVLSQPGVETNEVARSLGLRWANVVHHVGTLERGGHLSVRRLGGRTALFPANMGYRGKEEKIALLRRETPRRIHEVLLQQPGLDQSGLAALLGLTQQRVSQSLRHMEQVGLVRAQPEGRRRHYFAEAPLT